MPKSIRNGIADGDEFRPDRWLPSDPDAAKLAALFMPFSLGRRNCVGQNLAMLELKMVSHAPHIAVVVDLLSKSYDDLYAL